MLYRELLNNPPRIIIKKDAKEVVFTTVSVMCDNINYLVFKKKDDEFSLSGRGHALSNWKMKGDYITDLHWAADEQDWNKVIKIINSGDLDFGNLIGTTDKFSKNLVGFNPDKLNCSSVVFINNPSGV